MLSLIDRLRMKQSNVFFYNIHATLYSEAYYVNKLKNLGEENGIISTCENNNITVELYYIFRHNIFNFKITKINEDIKLSRFIKEFNKCCIQDKIINVIKLYNNILNKCKYCNFEKECYLLHIGDDVDENSVPVTLIERIQEKLYFFNDEIVKKTTHKNLIFIIYIWNKYYLLNKESITNILDLHIEKIKNNQKQHLLE